MDYEFLADLKKAEASTDALDIEDDIDGFYATNEGRKIRGMKLYSVLSSYLRNRPLKVLRSTDNMDLKYGGDSQRNSNHPLDLEVWQWPKLW